MQLILHEHENIEKTHFFIKITTPSMKMYMVSKILPWLEPHGSTIPMFPYCVSLYG
jgi:hypothetical protein